jgi:hypothetical protein
MRLQDATLELTTFQSDNLNHQTSCGTTQSPYGNKALGKGKRYET